MMLTIQQLALAHMSMGDLAIAHVASVSRSERAACLGVDWYRPEHRNLPLDRQRFCVARFEWRGGRWRRVYKYGGPKPLDQIQSELEHRSARLGIPTIDRA